MKEQVPENVKKERSGVLRDLGKRKNLDFRKSFVNRELKMVVETKTDACSNLVSGLTDNYIRVHIPDVNSEYIGKEIAIRIKDANSEENLATIL